MTAPPPLFDRAALLRNRQRATEDGMFLHHAARGMVEDRLSIVNRSFTDATVIASFPTPWRDLIPGAEVLDDDETLLLMPDSRDLIVHAMSLHNANDPVGQLIQCRRALRADGLFIAVLLGGASLSALRNVLGTAESHVTGGLSPRVHPMADIRDLGALLQRAGFAMPVADSDSLTVEYRDAWHLMRDLRAMGEGNALAERLRHFTRPEVLKTAARLYKDQFVGENGRLPAQFEIITLTGWAPAKSQPQPLRPGSATARLSDALGTDEIDLPD